MTPYAYNACFRFHHQPGAIVAHLGKLLTFGKLEKILKRGLEQRSRLNESFDTRKIRLSRSRVTQMLDALLPNQWCL
jgi:hypothetical protein